MSNRNTALEREDACRVRGSDFRPSVSAVVVTHRAYPSLVETLQVLVQDSAKEVILVASREKGLEAALAPLQSRIAVSAAQTFRVVWCNSGLGPSHYRNEGARAASGDIILYVDSDCIPKPGLIASHLQEYGDPDVVAVGGVTRLRSVHGSRWERVLLSSVYVLGFNFAHTRQPPSWVPSSNFSVKRSAVLSTPFDDRFPSAGGGEDVDLCWRLLADGPRINTSPSAIVVHDVWGPFHAVLSRLFRWGRAEARLMSKYPTLTVQAKYNDFTNPAKRHAAELGLSDAVILFIFDLSYLAGMRFQSTVTREWRYLSRRIAWEECRPDTVRLALTKPS